MELTVCQEVGWYHGDYLRPYICLWVYIGAEVFYLGSLL